MCRAQQTIIGVKLAIGEPEAVVGARIEPARMIIFGAVLQDRGGGAQIACNAVNELDQIIGAGIEGRLTVFAAR